MTPKQIDWCETRVPGAFRKNYRRAMEGRKPLLAIRQRCLDCMGWQITEVRNCTIETCPLWAYRMGKRTKDPNAKPRQGPKHPIGRRVLPKNLDTTEVFPTNGTKTGCGPPQGEIGPDLPANSTPN